MGKPHLTYEQAYGGQPPAPACALALTFCGGPTAAVAEGEVCENCAAALVAQIEAGLGLTGQACSYCGTAPARHTSGEFFICRDCGLKALDAVRDWYKRVRPAARQKARAARKQG